jgi:hypothetical protein
MDHVLTKYKHFDFFIFRKKDVLKKVCTAPMKPGVYLIYACKYDAAAGELVYIGKSGTLKHTGEFCKQLLCKRINNRHEKASRQKYFEEKLRIEKLSHLRIAWYVTFDVDCQDLPGYVEGVLIQEFYNINGVLPKWNKGF